MTMDSAPARHTGQGGTGPVGASASAGNSTAIRRSVTAIHPPRRPRADPARPALRPRRRRRRAGTPPQRGRDPQGGADTPTD
ncbi:sugar transferase, partial [Streptomyces goshikiensis]